MRHSQHLSFANFANFDFSGVSHLCENYWYSHYLFISIILKPAKAVFWASPPFPWLEVGISWRLSKLSISVKIKFWPCPKNCYNVFFSKMLSVFRGIWRWKHSTRLKTKLMYSSKTCTQSNYLRSLKGI